MHKLTIYQERKEKKKKKDWGASCRGDGSVGQQNSVKYPFQVLQQKKVIENAFDRYPNVDQFLPSFRLYHFAGTATVQQFQAING